MVSLRHHHPEGRDPPWKGYGFTQARGWRRFNASIDTHVEAPTVTET